MIISVLNLLWSVCSFSGHGVSWFNPLPKFCLSTLKKMLSHLVGRDWFVSRNIVHTYFRTHRIYCIKWLCSRCFSHFGYENRKSTMPFTLHYSFLMTCNWFFFPFFNQYFSQKDIIFCIFWKRILKDNSCDDFINILEYKFLTATALVNKYFKASVTQMSAECLDIKSSIVGLYLQFHVIGKEARILPKISVNSWCSCGLWATAIWMGRLSLPFSLPLQRKKKQSFP